MGKGALSDMLGDTQAPLPLRPRTQLKWFTLGIVALVSVVAVMLGYDIGVMADAILYIEKDLNLTLFQKEAALGCLNFVSGFGAIFTSEIIWVGVHLCFDFTNCKTMLVGVEDWFPAELVPNEWFIFCSKVFQWIISANLVVSSFQRFGTRIRRNLAQSFQLIPTVKMWRGIAIQFGFDMVLGNGLILRSISLILMHIMSIEGRRTSVWSFAPVVSYRNMRPFNSDLVLLAMVSYQCNHINHISVNIVEREKILEHFNCWPAQTSSGVTTCQGTNISNGHCFTTLY